MGDGYFYESESDCCSGAFWWLQDCVTSQASEAAPDNPWYPDWSQESNCVQDGKQPHWLGDGYLYSSQSECCEDNFWWDEDCISSPSLSLLTLTNANVAANAVTADDSNPWYPKWGDSRCVNDGDHESVSETYQFDSATECCSETLWYVDITSCTGAEGGASPYYPDYGLSTCLNDGNHRSVSEMYHYDDLQTCCDSSFWWALETCTSGGSGPSPTPGPDPYYPKWEDETCLNDGGHSSVASVYHYETQEGELNRLPASVIHVAKSDSVSFLMQFIDCCDTQVRNRYKIVL